MKNLPYIALLLLLVGCRGSTSDLPPVHINPNMDFQQKFEAQEANPLFADGRAMRPPVPGTVARGFLRASTPYYTGLDEAGTPVATMPVDLTLALVTRGRQRYNIYCSPCHGRAGDGQGIVIARGFVPAPSYFEQRLIDAPDGHLYDVITNGYNTMPSYAQQIPVQDRWAIVSYIRALQFSQNATEGDIPASELAKIAGRGN
jgi:mono/diheme cytochrome c family protein